jgi:ribonuclease BN (tRNA processing enzyme)
VYTLPGALDAVLALDGPEMMRPGLTLHEFSAGDRFEAGPFIVNTQLLPHFVPNAGLLITPDGRSLAYTGDCGPSRDVVALARDADLFLAEATYADTVPAKHAGQLSSAAQAGRAAAQAGAGRLMLTHLWPGSDPGAAVSAARRGYEGNIAVARGGIIIDLGP